MYSYLLYLLYIQGNSRITDSSVRSLVKACPDLRHLHLVDCERLTDLSLKALSICKNLTVANVADCIRYTSSYFVMIIELIKLTIIRPKDIVTR